MLIIPQNIYIVECTRACGGCKRAEVFSLFCVAVDAREVSCKPREINLRETQTSSYLCDGDEAHFGLVGRGGCDEWRRL